jgi:dynein heavy chain
VGGNEREKRGRVFLVEVVTRFTQNREAALRFAFVLLQARVEEEAEKAAIEAENCEHIAKTVTVQQIDCERDLAAAVPAVLAAEEALKTLNKKDITELKNFTKPPPGVEKVTECVLLLLSPPKQLVRYYVAM